jgi:hypothetical protein
MHSNDQHFLVIGTVEDADAPALGKAARCAPKEIMFKLLGARLFKAEDLAAFRIHPGHDVPNGAIFASSVHSLKDQQQGILVGRVVKLLQRAQLLHVLVQEFFVLLIRLAVRGDSRRPLTEVDLLVWQHTEIL